MAREPLQSFFRVSTPHKENFKPIDYQHSVYFFFDIFQDKNIIKTLHYIVKVCAYFQFFNLCRSLLFYTR